MLCLAALFSVSVPLASPTSRPPSVIQATTVLLVLFAILIFATHFSGQSLVVGLEHNYSHDLLDKSTDDKTTRLDECKDKAKATTLDITLSVIGYIASVIVMVSPWARVTKKIDGQENLVKDRWFMAYLGIVTLNSIAWVAYSSAKDCCCDATIYIIVGSTVGAVASSLCGLIGLLRDIGHVINPDDKMMFLCVFVINGAVTFLGHNLHTNGYFLMAGSLVAHLCRLMGTDYTRFSCLQCIVSLIGFASGFLSIQHPHLIKTEPFRITSMVLAGIRFLELLWWIVLYVRAFFIQLLWWIVLYNRWCAYKSRLVS